MKKIYTLHLLLLLAIVLPSSGVFAQVCTPDPQYTTVGIFPSDTLPDFEVGTAASEVVDFIFPDDTVFLGQTLAFDSFLVTQVSSIPANLMYECNQNHPTCNYVVTPGQLARGCVVISGTPASQSPAYPAYDSIIVTGQGWVTVPILGPQGIDNDIPIYYRIATPSNLDASLAEQIDFQAGPNPVTAQSVVRYNLPATYDDVNIGVYDISGKLVHTIHSGTQSAGRHILPVTLNTELTAGTYFVRFDLNGGEYTTTKKLIALN